MTAVFSADPRDRCRTGRHAHGRRPAGGLAARRPLRAARRRGGQSRRCGCRCRRPARRRPAHPACLGDPLQHARADRRGVLGVQEVADAGEHVEPRAGREVRFGVANQPHVDTAVVLAVQVERGLGRRQAQRPGIRGAVVGERRLELRGRAQAALRPLGGQRGRRSRGSSGARAGRRRRSRRPRRRAPRRAPPGPTCTRSARAARGPRTTARRGRAAGSRTSRAAASGPGAVRPATYVASAPQSLPISTARSSPPSASCRALASPASAPRPYAPSGATLVGAYPRMNGATAWKPAAARRAEQRLEGVRRVGEPVEAEGQRAGPRLQDREVDAVGRDAALGHRHSLSRSPPPRSSRRDARLIPRVEAAVRSPGRPPAPSAGASAAARRTAGSQRASGRCSAGSAWGPCLQASSRGAHGQVADGTVEVGHGEVEGSRGFAVCTYARGRAGPRRGGSSLSPCPRSPASPSSPRPRS